MSCARCPRCRKPEPADYCWDGVAGLDCPLEYPPRYLRVTDLWRAYRDLAKRVAKLENPPCCAGGPQWGHAWDCATLPG